MMGKRKKNNKSEFGTTIPLFYKIGHATYKMINNIGIFHSYFDRLADRLKTIYPKYNREEILDKYISYKFMNVYVFMMAGVLLIGAYSAAYSKDGSILKLQRPDYWSEDETKHIVAKTDNMEDELDVTVSHQKLSDNVMREIIEKKAEELPELILGGNKSLNNVTTDLKLVSQIPETQIDVYWNVEENNVLLSDGTIIEENISLEGDIVKLMATLTFEELVVNTEFYVNVKQRNLTKQEKELAEIMQKIKQADIDDAEKNELILPEKVKGKKVSYFIPGDDDKRGLVVILLCIGVCLLFFVQDEKLEKQRAKRENQMLIDYPEIINKLVIYLGAGLTIQGAFEMISKNYLQDKSKRKNYKRFAYEEIVYMCREIQGGVSFRSGLEHFSVRCNVLPFRKLTMLLLQNLKKGSSELLVLLRNEAVSAFETRKNTAKKMGEEAGTKILLPMLMMLGIVLIILIVPACMAFQI